MSFAEVFLRLGSTLVAWMVIYAYFLWVAVLRQVGCEANGDEIYRLLLAMAPITVAFSYLLCATRPLTDVHRILRWLCAPLVLLIPYAMSSVWPIFLRVTVAGEGFCALNIRSEWQAWWAPIQMVAFLMVIYGLYRTWLAVAVDKKIQ